MNAKRPVVHKEPHKRYWRCGESVSPPGRVLLNIHDLFNLELTT